MGGGGGIFYRPKLIHIIVITRTMEYVLTSDIPRYCSSSKGQQTNKWMNIQMHPSTELIKGTACTLTLNTILTQTLSLTLSLPLNLTLILNLMLMIGRLQAYKCKKTKQKQRQQTTPPPPHTHQNILLVLTYVNYIGFSYNSSV